MANKLEEVFVKADSGNLPEITASMFYNFITTDKRFDSPEVRNAKSEKSSRGSYGDAAVGYVCLKREEMLCTVRAKMTPEHRKNEKAYTVTVVIDEENKKIVQVSCDDCPAGEGGCKHAYAFMMWINRRSEEPACTEVKCYWKESILSGAGTRIPFVLATDMVKHKKHEDDSLPDNSTFLQDVISELDKNQSDTVLSRYTICLIDREVHNLSIHQMLILYISQEKHPNADGFLEFTKRIMDPILCLELERQTRNQSEDLLWGAARYARVTASKLYEVARCNTPLGSLSKQIVGVSKVHDNKFMKRGRILEQQVFDELCRKGYKLSKCGFFVLPAYPIFDGSPDGISNDYILEIKCPASESTFKNYLHKGNITEKYKAQMMLQMFVAKKKKGLFCMAHWDFEVNHEFHLLWVNFDGDYLKSLMDDSAIFWKEKIYPLLRENLCK